MALPILTSAKFNIAYELLIMIDCGILKSRNKFPELTVEEDMYFDFIKGMFESNFQEDHKYFLKDFIDEGVLDDGDLPILEELGIDLKYILNRDIDPDLFRSALINVS